MYDEKTMPMFSNKRDLMNQMQKVISVFNFLFLRALELFFQGIRHAQWISYTTSLKGRNLGRLFLLFFD